MSEIEKNTVLILSFFLFRRRAGVNFSYNGPHFMHDDFELMKDMLTN